MQCQEHDAGDVLSGHVCDAHELMHHGFDGSVCCSTGRGDGEHRAKVALDDATSIITGCCKE